MLKSAEQLGRELAQDIAELSGLDRDYHSMRANYLHEGLMAFMEALEGMGPSAEVLPSRFAALMWIFAKEAARISYRVDLSEAHADLITDALTIAAIQVANERRLPRAA